MQKKILYVTLFAVIVVAVIFLFFNQGSNNSQEFGSSDWKTYDDGLFSFEYPGDWEAFNDGEASITYITPDHSLRGTEGIRLSRGSISISGVEPKTSIIDFNGVQVEKKVFNRGDKKEIEIKPLTEKNQYQSSNGETYFIYWIQYTRGPEIQFQEEVDKILASFEIR